MITTVRSTINIMHIEKALMAVVAGMFAGGQAAGVKGAVMDGSLAAVDHIVRQVRADPRLDRPSVERMLGASLRHASSTRFFITSEAEGIRAGPLALRAELREPITGSGAQAGPLLIVRIASGCPNRHDVEKRYAPWTLSDAPRGRSVDEQTSWSRDEVWGRLSFSFAEGAPDCLRTMTFDAKPRG